MVDIVPWMKECIGNRLDSKTTYSKVFSINKYILKNKYDKYM